MRAGYLRRGFNQKGPVNIVDATERSRVVSGKKDNNRRKMWFLAALNFILIPLHFFLCEYSKIVRLFL